MKPAPKKVVDEEDDDDNDDDDEEEERSVVDSGVAEEDDEDEPKPSKLRINVNRVLRWLENLFGTEQPDEEDWSGSE